MNCVINCKSVSLTYPANRGVDLKNLPKFLGGKYDSETRSISSLNNINFQLYSGDRVAITGHNGSGKSTLLRVLSGIYQPTSGDILRDDETYRLTTAFDQAYGLDYELSGLDNLKIRYMSSFNNVNFNILANEVREISGLGDYLNFPVRVYSTGMITRLLVGYLLATKSEIIMIDEGINFADKKFHSQVDDRINDYILNSKLMVVATHDEHFIKKYCNRIVVMESGSIIEDRYV
jgi:lipopolysaccharide transport system ATP-binding protein